jgi:hypothetical protein
MPSGFLSGMFPQGYNGAFPTCLLLTPGCKGFFTSDASPRQAAEKCATRLMRLCRHADMLIRRLTQPDGGRDAETFP